MKLIQYYLLLLFLSFSIGKLGAQQRIGLVLSGGGATGLAHVGVLKALEERGIPIDYITGTSAGALIGSMYAIGLSPEEIEQFLLSDEFQLMTTGKLKPQQHFLYKEEEVDAGLFDLSFSRDSILKKSLPTNFTKSTYLDFEMLKLFGTTGASYGNDFDSLFVPFRCVSSDIANKKSIVFSEGQLNQAVRASMTYPFYFDPIRINGILLFDGGLYNNFPADVLYKEFNPDFIIGSNVSYNAAPPSEDDLISQLTNMLVSYSDYKLPCDAGVLIEPETDINTFEFSKVKQAIDDGYKSAQAYLDSIELHVSRKISKEELTARRKMFRSKIQPLSVSSITNNYYRKKDITYARKSMILGRKREVLSPAKTEKRYYRLCATPQIEFVYPLAYLKSDSTYNLDLEVRKAKDFKIDLGGHFSSRAVNTGYVGFTFRSIGKTASSFHASSYFGKFYGSAKVSYQLEIPSIYPISVSGYFIMNRWDYFRSFATFFEDVQPSFLIQNEMQYGIKFNHPIGNTSKSTFDFHVFNLEDDYYQTSNFTNKDIYDLTHFDGSSSSWEFMKHSLNRKQFASSGHLFRLKMRYVEGNERTIPGSTSTSQVTTRKYHQWINLSTEFQSFVIDNRYFHLGVHGKGVVTSQSLFANYTASLLSLPAFTLIPDAETFFLPEYRSPQFVSAGLNMVFSFAKSLDLRFDTYYYQPLVIIQKNEDGTFSYSKPFKGETYMASASFIYHSFIGPLRFSLNFFPKQLQPLSFQLSFGYVLFNDRAIR